MDPSVRGVTAGFDLVPIPARFRAHALLGKFLCQALGLLDNSDKCTSLYQLPDLNQYLHKRSCFPEIWPIFCDFPRSSDHSYPIVMT